MTVAIGAGIAGRTWRCGGRVAGWGARSLKSFNAFDEIKSGICGKTGAICSRCFGSQFVGANDLTWYVKADSPIKDKKDLAGKSVAYSTAGSSTYAAVTVVSNGKVVKKKKRKS